MKHTARRLPWTRDSVPHAVLDINRGCNICCRDCYNTLPPFNKSLREIEADLDLLMRRRKLHSVSLVGGETTLHPELCDVIRLIARRGIHVELFTNGVKLDAALVTAIRHAGAEVVFLHIERGQQRPDLPANAGTEQLRRLREEKIALLAAHGLDAGLSITSYDGQLDELLEAVRFTITSRHANHLLVTLWRDVRRIHSVKGDVDDVMYGQLEPAMGHAADTLDNRIVENLLRTELGFDPFGFLGSNVVPNDARWLSYLIGVVHDARGTPVCSAMQQSLFEPAFLRLRRWLTGGYPFYQKQSTSRFRIHLLLNGLFGGTPWKNLRLAWLSLGKNSILAHKRLLFQCLATVDEQGRIIHCENCPDAVVRDGRLVPLCISDRVISAENRRP